MRVETISYNIYKYNELPADVKEKVKEWYLKGQNPYIFTEDCKEDLRNLFGRNNLGVQYSLNNCQGDGFNIYGEIDARSIFKCLEEHNGGRQLERFESEFTEQEKEIILAYAEKYGAIEIPYNKRYCYSLADRIIFAEDWENELEYCFDSIDGTLIKRFERLVQEIFMELCNSYKRMGYEYFYEISEEDLEEICEANDWEFYEDGTIY